MNKIKEKEIFYKPSKKEIISEIINNGRVKLMTTFTYPVYKDNILDKMFEYIINESKYELINNLSVGDFGIKYLDKFDIKSFGIKYIKTHAGLNEDYFEFNDNKHYMDYNYDSKYLRIAFIGERDVTRFSGTIKSKGEFTQLLNFLELNNQDKVL